MNELVNTAYDISKSKAFNPAFRCSDQHQKAVRMNAFSTALNWHIARLANNAERILNDILM